MALNINHSVLNTGELELLSELFAQDDDDSILKKLAYNLSSSAEGESWLYELGRVGEMKLSANCGNHRLVFPVQIKTDDFANLQMILKPPKIFEVGNKLRSWRLTVRKQNIYLVNEAGEESSFQVNDISTSGISLLIGDHAQAEFPDVLDNVFLRLPNRETLTISGLQISRADEKTVAYSFAESTDETVLASLCEYLFECHEKHYQEADGYLPS